jgi:flagellar hook-associated protein 1 FlgK
VNAPGNSVLYREDVFFAGVNGTTVSRAWDDFRAADSRNASSSAERAGTREQWLTSIETAMGDGATSVGSTMGTFFNAATSLASTPNDPLARRTMLLALDDAAGSIRTTATRLAQISDGIKQSADLEVTGLNTDLAALAKVNTSLLRAAKDGTARASFEDERDRLIDSIAQRIDVSATIGADGQATLTLGGITTTTLLDGNSRGVAAATVSADGRIALQLYIDGNMSVLPVSGGRLAGLVDVAGATADIRASLNNVATQFTQAVNNWNAQGRDVNGNPGAPLLAMPSDAASLVTTTLDPAAIAAASSGGAENGNLLTIGTLRASDGTEAKWNAMIASLAQTVSSAKAQSSTAATYRDDSFAARDQVNGVDLDREAAELMRFQRAYEGCAKVIQVSRETMQSILDLF